MTFKNRFCCENLTSGFEKNKTKALSCELFTNEHLTIQGQSDSGKSTILKVLATLFPKKSGKLSPSTKYCIKQHDEFFNP